MVEISAPKSTGGVAPIKRSWQTRIACAKFQDHNSQDAIAAYYGDSPAHGQPVLPALWSAQFYITSGATVASHPDLPIQLLKTIWDVIVDAYPLRLDVYFLPNADIDTCMAHYRKEKASRLPARPPLWFVETYGNYSGTYSMLFMVPDKDWHDKGITSAYFDDEDEPGLVDVEDGIPVSSLEKDQPWTRRKSLGEQVHRLAVETTEFGSLRELYEKTLEGEPSAMWSLPELDMMDITIAPV